MNPQANPVTTTPLSDRPLTAEDVALLREGDLVAPISDLTDYRGGKLIAGAPVPVLNVSDDGYIRVTDPVRGHLSYAFTFVSRPTANVETGASEGGDYTMALADKQAFEAFPALASHIEQMAVSGRIGSMIAWDGFLRELNAALTPSPPVQLSEGEREAVARLKAISVKYDTWGRAAFLGSFKEAEQGVADLRTILAALTRTTGEG